MNWIEKEKKLFKIYPGDLGRYPENFTTDEITAHYWLTSLDTASFEGVWFAKFAQYYSCKLEAAFVYLNLNLD